MSLNPSQLSELFPVQGLEFESGAGGLTKAVIKTPITSGELYLYGSHVTAWQPVGNEPVLWMSRQSNFARGKAIRGGVPICFPWFGPHTTDSTAPAHGFARIVEWELKDASSTVDGSISLTLQTNIDPFHLTFRVSFGRILSMSLTTELPLNVSAPQQFEDALHTYFAVGDIRQISVSGLETASYIDKVDEAKEKSAVETAIDFSGETDRVYMSTEATCILTDPVLKRRITVSKRGSLSTIVWNPWIQKSARMPDFGDNEWPEMVCIETANVGVNSIEISPGQSHTTTAVVSVVRSVT